MADDDATRKNEERARNWARLAAEVHKLSPGDRLIVMRALGRKLLFVKQGLDPESELERFLAMEPAELEQIKDAKARAIFREIQERFRQTDDDALENWAEGFVEGMTITKKGRKPGPER